MDNAWNSSNLEQHLLYITSLCQFLSDCCTLPFMKLHMLVYVATYVSMFVYVARYVCVCNSICLRKYLHAVCITAYVCVCSCISVYVAALVCMHMFWLLGELHVRQWTFVRLLIKKLRSLWMIVNDNRKWNLFNQIQSVVSTFRQVPCSCLMSLLWEHSFKTPSGTLLPLFATVYSVLPRISFNLHQNLSLPVCLRFLMFPVAWLHWALLNLVNVALSNCHLYCNTNDTCKPEYIQTANTLQTLLRIGHQSRFHIHT